MAMYAKVRRMRLRDGLSILISYVGVGVIGEVGQEDPSAGHAAAVRLAGDGRPGCGDRPAQVGVDLVGEGLGIEATCEDSNIRKFTAQFIQAGGLIARIADSQRHAIGSEIARSRKAADAQADDERPGCGSLTGCCPDCHCLSHLSQRSFSVASPTRTRIRLMIQKRTMTRGSGQPLSS